MNKAIWLTKDYEGDFYITIGKPKLGAGGRYWYTDQRLGTLIPMSRKKEFEDIFDPDHSMPLNSTIRIS